MKNYYAFSIKKTLKESKEGQNKSLRFKSGKELFAMKICNSKFGENRFQLYSFENFNDISTFKKII